MIKGNLDLWNYDTVKQEWQAIHDSVKTRKIVLSLLKGFDYIAPHVHVYTLKNENFSRDPRIVDSMNNDPLIKGESEPTQTAKVIIDAARRLHEEFPLIKLPVLILHGTEDKATNPSGSQFFYDTTGSKRSSTYRQQHLPNAISRAEQMDFVRQTILRNCWWRPRKTSGLNSASLLEVSIKKWLKKIEC
jgi:esterase/lipase